VVGEEVSLWAFLLRVAAAMAGVVAAEVVAAGVDPGVTDVPGVGCRGCC
jgi:hypothetical protein